MINNGGKGQGGNIIGWLAFVTRKTEESAGQVLIYQRWRRLKALEVTTIEAGTSDTEHGTRVEVTEALEVTCRISGTSDTELDTRAELAG